MTTDYKLRINFLLCIVLSILLCNKLGIAGRPTFESVLVRNQQFLEPTKVFAHAPFSAGVLDVSFNTGVAAWHSNSSVSLPTLPGSLDLSFGSEGKVLTLFGNNALGGSVAIQPDGKIVVSGNIIQQNRSFIVVVRYLPDGSLDPSFGSGGRVITSVGNDNDYGQTIVLQSDGKILVGGGSVIVSGIVFALVRYNPDGSLDTTFGGTGSVRTQIAAADVILSLALQNDGKIVATGDSTNGLRSNFAVARYNSDGSLDGTFGNGGIVTTEIGKSDDVSNSVVLQSDGKVVIGGQTKNGNNIDFAVVRYLSDGSLDGQFGTDGIVKTPVGNSDDLASKVQLQADQKIVLTGSVTMASGISFAAVRYQSDGELDNLFGNAGKAIISFGSGDYSCASSAIQSNGRIVLAGYAPGITSFDFALSRLESSGDLDNSFGSAGLVTTSMAAGNDYIRSMAIQNDGKIVAVGAANDGSVSRIALARYNGDIVGTPTPTATPTATPTQTPTATPTPTPPANPALFDFDADGRSDISVFRPSSGAWYLQRSRDGLYGIDFGYSDDTITPADYDGDGKTDIAVYRPSTGVWYIFNSSDGNVRYEVFGLAEDLPTPADYDGDGKADISVFRPSTGTWYRQNSSDGSFFAVQFGASEDKPTVGDFDGDGKSDIAVFRPSTGAWYQVNSSDGSLFGEIFGFGTDVTVPADYDGDGKTDLAVFRPSNGFWYIKNSNGAVYTAYPFGLADDIPAPGDFDGDGKADISVFRPSDGTWYRQNSSDGSFFAYQFGTAGDKPTQTAFRY